MMESSTTTADHANVASPMGLFFQNFFHEHRQDQSDWVDDDGERDDHVPQQYFLDVLCISDNARFHPTRRGRLEANRHSTVNRAPPPPPCSKSLDPAFRWDSRGAPLSAIHELNSSFHGSFDNFLDTPVFPPRPLRNRPLSRSRSDEPEATSAMALPTKPQRQGSIEIDPALLSLVQQSRSSRASISSMDWVATAPPLPPVRRESVSVPCPYDSDCCVASVPTPPKRRVSICLEQDLPTQPPKRRVSLCLEEDSSQLFSPTQPQRRVSICSDDSSSVGSELSEWLPVAGLLQEESCDLSDAGPTEASSASPNLEPVVKEDGADDGNRSEPTSPLLGPKVTLSKTSLIDDEDGDDDNDVEFRTSSQRLSLITA